MRHAHHQGITDAELHIDGYMMFRKDRHGKGGGVLLYVSEELNAGLNGELTSNAFQESIWCNIKTGKSSMLVGLCYRCPTSSESNNDSLLQLISKASDLCTYKHLLVMGDFNFPEISYKDNSCSSRL